MTTYTISSSKKRLISIALPLILGMFGIVLFCAERELPTNNSKYLLLCLFAAYALGTLLILLHFKRYKVTIDNDSIRSYGRLHVRELSLKQVKGVVINSRYLVFLPMGNGAREIKVKSSVEHFDELCIWALQHYEQLPLGRLRGNKEEILCNPIYGDSREDRARRLNSAISITRFINAVALFVGLSAMFLPVFSRIQVMACMLFPVATIACVHISKGLIRFDAHKHSPYPSIFAALLFPSAALLARSVFDFSIFSYNGFWLPFLVLFLLVVLLMVTSSEFEGEYKHGRFYATLLGVMCIAGMYSYGTVVEANAIFSSGKTIHYKAAVLNKRVSYHKNTSKSYSFTLSQWGPQTIISDVTVSSQIYDNVNLSDSVDVQFRSGLFGIQYFRVRMMKR